MAPSGKDKGRVRSSASTGASHSPMGGGSALGTPRKTGSSKINTWTREVVADRDGSTCLFCGAGGGLNVCHIVARNKDADYQIEWLWDRWVRFAMRFAQELTSARRD